MLLPVDPDASARGDPRAACRSAPAATSRVRRHRHRRPGLARGPDRHRDRRRRAARRSRSYAGRTDGYGNELAVTAPAVADEIAGAAELAQGKLGGRPFAVVRGRADLVLPAGRGRRRAPRRWCGRRARDLFGYGAREAVVRALRGDPADRLAVRRAGAAPTSSRRDRERARRRVAAPVDGRRRLVVPGPRAARRAAPRWRSPTAGRRSRPMAASDVRLRRPTP